MKNIFIIFCCLLMSIEVAAAEQSPQTYYEIEIKARELTLEGMEKRLECMLAGCSVSEQLAIDERYQEKIMAMHEEYSTTSSQLAAWYTHHALETENYFLTSPQLQMRLDELETSFETLSDKINILLEVRQ
ncbi:MAG: hypothetical protein OEL66_07295 [Desulfobulbaceae bacterium]|nr:hypothetical protein [Desulfobulbaceae bacterium]